MAARHPDPFEDLRLDERFVRSARFLEPSARERAGQVARAHGTRCQVVPAPRGLQGFVHRLFVAPPRPAPRTRRLTRVLAVVTLAVGMISLTVVALRQTAGRGTPVATEPLPVSQVSTPVGGPASASSVGEFADGAAATGGGSGGGGGVGFSASSVPLTVDPAVGVPGGFDLAPGLFAAIRKGDCMAWSARSVSPVTPVRVDCAAPHVDEVTKIVDLGGRFADWPGVEVLRTTARDVCAGSMREYVGALDVAPHQVVGSVRPDEASWERGVRAVVCTIRSDDLAARSGRFVVAGAVRS
ncbi:septum formation family protein [Frankia sp. Mgl5]|uniref:septum formation family protein n=1 Tax=Frankia sp. Mgl5 TaxID=2933793 RepID=UPI00200EA1BA|nr:septum formation family protein [Frankia sp. Mgl5]MCK9927041.1 septum formation family protein [Frankia sp. Mgl5]